MKLTQKETTTYKVITTTKQKSPCCNAIVKEEHLGNIRIYLFCIKCGNRTYFLRKNNTLKQTIKMKPFISNKPMTVKEVYPCKQTNFELPITIDQAIEYEVSNYWLIPYIKFSWKRELLCKCITRKVKRKYNRYKQYIKLRGK